MYTFCGTQLPFKSDKLSNRCVFFPAPSQSLVHLTSFELLLHQHIIYSENYKQSIQHFNFFLLKKEFSKVF